ncbi:type II toxin-antitoxin system YafQ family toxin [Novosphingobium umbonatum]|uniref:Type II toxin-antitoxin system YafQ family toxin n=1 Tax=Novosphingobium umbonatum TaxID=1908524 RepID=A0A3S2Y6H4_9SPHN|nr:type II toxin-antitoxin system YafQ family toxin [Novosphingobium umbonatum]RVU04642.1 type II toxin-antitoxin system YafQ family toxin [Novosphingobium umbonatum]
MAKRDKAATLPRTFDLAKAFRKDWERLSRSGRYDMRQLKEAMLLLIANDAPLPPEWRDHALKGEWAGTRECHIGGDFLLIYEVDDTAGPGGTLVFVRAGTHSELFK